MPRRKTSEKHKKYTLFLACLNKRSYKSQNEAEKVAELQMLENMGLELSVYKCNDCKFWHLTRQSH